eukprot:c35219_g1_i1 orf=141-335(+)
MIRLRVWIKATRKGYGRGSYMTTDYMAVMQSKTSREKGERARIKRNASQVTGEAQNSYNYMWEL